MLIIAVITNFWHVNSAQGNISTTLKVGFFWERRYIWVNNMEMPQYQENTDAWCQPTSSV